MTNGIFYGLVDLKDASKSTSIKHLHNTGSIVNANQPTTNPAANKTSTAVTVQTLC